jgi:DNA-directed RNA polymerase specialized sigma24 family protein/CheY-like chemotaxis protein
LANWATIRLDERSLFAAADRYVMPPMSISQAIASHLPALRRFARALCGSQQSGDAYVVALLEKIAKDLSVFPAGLAPKIALYQAFLKVWNSAAVRRKINAAAGVASTLYRLQALTPRPRQAFLLLSLESFSEPEIAQILQISGEEVTALIMAADREIKKELGPSGILIIEDDASTALYLENLVLGLGHKVTGLAKTHKEALLFAKKQKPELILSDIELADGSSGVDAVNEILCSFEVPVIFITGHAELLLTGTKPEPAFLIPKPFEARTVRAVIGQALFLEMRSRPSPRNR